MKLIIGGYAQGKLNYVLQKYDVKPVDVYDSKLPENAGIHDKTIVLNHFHNWVKTQIVSTGNPEEEIAAFVKVYPNCVIISDEVGNGIVPIDALEREYRQRCGRILVELAKKAEEVERVICGIGQRIK